MTSEKPTPELKACPFCGSSAVLPTTANGETWISCALCDASGRMSSTEAGAIAAWNRRSPSVQGEEEGGSAGGGVEPGPCVDDVPSVSEPIQGLGEVGSVLNIEPGLRNAAPERRPAGEPIENGPTLFVAPEVEAEAHGRNPTTALAHRHTDAEIEAICRAHDQEDAAQRGEPSPWSHFDCDGDCDDCREFRADRIAAMRAGLEAVAALQDPGVKS